MSPLSTPKQSCSTFVMGARQLVVHDAFEMICSFDSYASVFTFMQNMGAVLDGAEITTFLDTPVHSATNTAPCSAHGMSFGSRWLLTTILCPLMMRFLPSVSTWPSKRPCAESYLNWYTM